MIGTRLPQSVIPLHPFKPDQNILHGLIQRMSHMELACYVRRRNHDGKRLLCTIHFRMKIFLFGPFLIQSVFNPFGIIGFGKFFLHKYLLIKNRSRLNPAMTSRTTRCPQV